MSSSVKVVLAGIGGFGNYYVQAFLDPRTDVSYKLVAAVDPVIQKTPAIPQVEMLQGLGVPLYPDLESCLAQHTPDLVILSTPIHFHCPQVCDMMARGINVLCEKPIAATVQEAYKMLEAESKSKAFTAIGYQWSYSRTIQAVKKDIMSGLFGKPIRLKSLILWPRRASYYARSWAARKKDAQGRWILDSPVANATAHFLHNSFFVLGKELHLAAEPESIVAELYRANPVENYDSAGLRVKTKCGTEIIFLTAHPSLTERGPSLCYEFENGTVTAEGGYHATFKATFKDGTTKVYGVSEPEVQQKIWDVVRACQTKEPVVCGIKTALSHLISANGAQDSMPDIVEVPKEFVRKDSNTEDPLTYIEGLDKAWTEAWEKGCLPSELGYLPWARQGKKIDLSDYRSYPGGK